MSGFGVVIPPDPGDANYGEGFPIRQAPARPMTDPGVVTPDKNAEECGAEYRGALPGGDVIDTCTLDSTHEMPLGKALRWWSPVCAPEPPRVPRPAPGTPQRGSVDGDSRDALRARLADVALHSRVPAAPPWGEVPEYVRNVWLGVVEGVVDEVEAIRREAAAEALGQLYARRPEMDCPTRKAIYDGLRCTCARAHSPVPRIDPATGHLARDDFYGRNT